MNINNPLPWAFPGLNNQKEKKEMTDKAKANLTRLLQSHSRQSRELGRALLKSSELSEEEQMEIDPDYLKIGDIWFHFICDPFIEEQARLNPFNPGPPR